MSKKNNSKVSTNNIKEIFKKRYLEMFNNDFEEYNLFIKTILQPQRKSLRINSIKVLTLEDKNNLLKKLEKKGLNLSPISWCEEGYFVEYIKEKRTDLGNLFEHFLGEIYIQEATSMTPPLVLDIPHKLTKNFIILDMAAAPGSKTTQIGALMKNNGILIANEIDWKRLGSLKINLERSGLKNVIITTYDGTLFPGNNNFDRILLDAPCSGSGVIRKSPKTLLTYNPKRLKQITRVQKKLLIRAFELLKPNGIMTYSTCSLEPEENELLIDEFIKEYQNAKLLDINLPQINKKRKFKSFFEKEISLEVSKKTLRIWPHLNDTNGFFLAKIQKLE